MTHNQIEYAKMMQDKRNQAAQLAENARHNKVSEQLEQVELDLKRDLNAITEKWNTKQYELQKSMQAINKQHYERQDSNQAYANYTNRLLAYETQRHNQNQETLNLIQSAIQSSDIDEKKRHNVASENIQNRETTARVNVLNAQSDLHRAQTRTESYKPAQIQADITSKHISSATNIVNSITGVVKSIAGPLTMGMAVR